MKYLSLFRAFMLGVGAVGLVATCLFGLISIIYIFLNFTYNNSFETKSFLKEIIISLDKVITVLCIMMIVMIVIVTLTGLGLNILADLGFDVSETINWLERGWV